MDGLMEQWISAWWMSQRRCPGFGHALVATSDSTKVLSARGDKINQEVYSVLKKYFYLTSYTLICARHPRLRINKYRNDFTAVRSHKNSTYFAKSEETVIGYP